MRIESGAKGTIPHDYLGNLVWEKTYGLACEGGCDVSGGVSVVPSGDGGFIVAGTTSESYTNYVYLLRVDGEGHQVWEKNMGSNSQNHAESITCDGDGYFVVTGYAGQESRDVYLLKFTDPDLEGVKCPET